MFRNRSTQPLTVPTSTNFPKDPPSNLTTLIHPIESPPNLVNSCSSPISSLGILRTLLHACRTRSYSAPGDCEIVEGRERKLCEEARERRSFRSVLPIPAVGIRFTHSQ